MAFKVGDKARLTIDATVYGKADAGGRTIYDLLFDDQVITIDPDVDSVDMTHGPVAKPEFYTVAELATRLAVGKMTIYRMVEGKEIPGAIRVTPRVFRVHAATFDAWLDEQVGRVAP